ncbi:MAG: isoprenylcysteine carboxylmethyltransferase family protein [Verrucomicrobiota bacterium]
MKTITPLTTAPHDLMPGHETFPQPTYPMQTAAIANPPAPSRLRDQGFVNLHRKLLFRVMTVGLISYLYFIPSPWKLSATTTLCGQFAGTFLIFAGILGRMFATISIGGRKDRMIVKTELYSVCRNPLYFASFLMALGVGLLSGRPDFMLLAAVCYLAIFYPMMMNEAKFLGRNFDDFAGYEKRVPLFFPNFGLWEERKNFEINFRLVKRTLFDASLALLAIPVILLVRAWA